MNKKEVAQTFLKMIAENQVSQAYEKFIATDFRHHNQWFKGDRQSLMTAMQEANHINPNKLLNVKMAIEEADRVITISHVRQNPQDIGVVVAHIFRFENSKVAELWDFGQALNKDSPNENGFF
jgi:predicted SnoaL-like aldol condensation-catalyzing enzyme